MTLVITGPQVVRGKHFVDSVSKNWHQAAMEFSNPRMLPRDHNHASDRMIDCDGWSSEPPFAVSTAKVVEDFETAIFGLLI